MIGWILLCAGVVAWTAWRIVFLRRWARLEQIIEDLSREKEVSPHGLLGSRKFARLAVRLARAGTAAEELRQRLEFGRIRFEAILASMSEGVLVTRHDRTVQVVNHSLMQMFGLPQSPLRQTVLSAFREAAIEKLIVAAQESGEPQMRELALSVRGGGNGTRYFDATAVPLRHPQHDVAGVVVVFHEVTRLRQLEEIRREFVSNVSHELGTPLSIFQGYLETLQDNPDMPREELADTVQIMKRHSLRLNALLGDLLALARMEARTEKLERSGIALDRFFAAVARDWAPRLRARDLTLTWEVEDGLPPLEADLSRLEQVFNNLIENAVKFTPPGGSITLRARAASGATVLEVKDTGEGVPPADLPHIFERFYRVEKARSRDAGGTGLGLSIVKHLMDLHGGTVKAESDHGRGTTIILRFPTVRADAC